MTIKPQADYDRYREPKPLDGYFITHDFELEIGAWSPDRAAQQPPREVHVVIHLNGIGVPIALRFRGPDTLGFLIEEMASSGTGTP